MASAASRISGETCEGRAKISHSIALTSALPRGAIASKAAGGTARCAGSIITRTAAKAKPCASASLATRCDFHVDRDRARERMELALVRWIRDHGIDAHDR